MFVNPFASGNFLYLLSGGMVYSWFFMLAMCAPLLLTALLLGFLGNKKMFLHKLGSHISPPLCVFASIAFLAPPAFFLVTGMLIDPLWLNLVQHPFVSGVLACSLVLPVLFCLVASRWKAWRQRPAVHMLFFAMVSLLTVIILFLSTYTAIAPYFPHKMVSDIFRANPAGTVELLFNTLLSQSILPGTLAACSYILSTGMTLCAGIGALWLVLRRNQDDFGRDYYAYATKVLSWWAGIFSLLQAGMVAFMTSRLAVALPQLAPLFEDRIIILYGACGAALLAGISWTAIALSASPMRLKPLTVVAFLLFFGSLLAQQSLFFPWPLFSR